MCVVRVDVERNRIQAVATVKSDAREIDAVYTLQWGESRTLLGRISTPPAEFLKFPMHVGDKYQVKFEYRGVDTAYAQSKQAYKMEVVGWEDVVVAAGRYRALKIVGDGWVSTPGLFQDTRVTRTWWYVPEVNRHVKFSLECNCPFRTSEELTDVRLLK